MGEKRNAYVPKGKSSLGRCLHNFKILCNPIVFPTTKVYICKVWCSSVNYFVDLFLWNRILLLMNHPVYYSEFLPSVYLSFKQAAVYIPLCYSRPRTSVSLIFSIFVSNERQGCRGPSEHVGGARPVPYHFRRRQSSVYYTWWCTQYSSLSRKVEQQNMHLQLWQFTCQMLTRTISKLLFSSAQIEAEKPNPPLVQEESPFRNTEEV